MSKVLVSLSEKSTHGSVSLHLILHLGVYKTILNIYYYVNKI